MIEDLGGHIMISLVLPVCQHGQFANGKVKSSPMGGFVVKENQRLWV